MLVRLKKYQDKLRKKKKKTWRNLKQLNVINVILLLMIFLLLYLTSEMSINKQMNLANTVNTLLMTKMN